MNASNLYDYDIVLTHKDLSAMSDNDVYKLLANLFPERQLYRISDDWRRDKRYILKGRGLKGDVIVGWLENQSNEQKPIKRLRHCPIL